MSDTQYTPVTVVCSRYSESKAGKQVVVFYKLDDNDAMTTEMLVLERRSFKASPGNVYELQAASNTTFRVGVKWLRQWREDEAAEMQAAAKAWELDRDAAALAKRKGSPVAVLEQKLTPLLQVYRSLPTCDRMSFKVWLMEYLSRNG